MRFGVCCRVVRKNLRGKVDPRHVRAEIRRIKALDAPAAKAMAFALLMQYCRTIPDGAGELLSEYDDGGGIKRRHIREMPRGKSLINSYTQGRLDWVLEGGPDYILVELFGRWKDRRGSHGWYGRKNFDAEFEAFGRGQGAIWELQLLFERHGV